MIPPTASLSPLVSSFNPTGKSFNQRLDAFLADAQKVYALKVRRDTGRSVEWQQKLHIAHMFLYNKYASTAPLKTDPGKRTIAWDYIANPTLVWSKVQFTDILRTKNGGPPTKEGIKWKQGHEPDREKTQQHLKQLLTSEKIGNNGQAMVSAGTKPCGVPCGCGAGQSKHLDDTAADLNSTDLQTLDNKLKGAKAGSLDDYLKKFGLHRPLLNHPSSPEKWHVEPL